MALHAHREAGRSLVLRHCHLKQKNRFTSVQTSALPGEVSPDTKQIMITGRETATFRAVALERRRVLPFSQSRLMTGYFYLSSEQVRSGKSQSTARPVARTGL